VTNEGEPVLTTVISMGVLVKPRATDSVPTGEAGASEKLMAVAVTVKFAEVVADVVPEAPFTVTVGLPGAMLAAVVRVSCVVPEPLGTVVGLKVQVTPEGGAGQLRVTVPLKPFCGVIVIVVLALVPAAMLAGLTALAERLKFTMVAAHAWAKANASGDPNPVTWS
jgi:hypothetical protein